MRLAVQDVSLGEGRTTEDIRAGLLASFRAQGVEPRSDLNGLASFLNAMNGPSVLRLPRLVKLGADGLRRLRQHEAATTAPPRDRDAADRSSYYYYDDDDDFELHKAFRVYAIYGLTAVGLAVAAQRTEGVARIVLAAMAVLLGAVTVWSVLFVGALDLLVRSARSRAPDPEVD
jgi:hypothetical protein